MIVRDYEIANGNGKTALLINPPVYDFDYRNYYNQPDGLLRVASLLKKKGFKTALIDFLAAKKFGKIPATLQPYDSRYKGLIRKHYGLSFKAFENSLRALDFYPDEIYLTSIMTYWWEGTRDTISILRRVFPKSTILLGGVYPTLCPEHAAANTGADIVVQGEIGEASDLWTDISLYGKKVPSYAIINFSRGCPFNCNYCAQRVLNGPGMRFRKATDIVDEIQHKHSLGVKTFWIFSDNFLIGDLFPETLEEIIRRDLRINISAPKGMEPRLMSRSLLGLMKKAGWKTINMAFESANSQMRESNWNRSHNTNMDFERAIELAGEYGFKHEAGGIVGFVLLGAPGEKLDDVRQTAMYLHERGVFIRPMPFTPVPQTTLFKQYQGYIEKNCLSLADLNEKLYPFAEFNNASLADYQSLYNELIALNSRLYKRSKTRLFGAEDLLKFSMQTAPASCSLACPA